MHATTPYVAEHIPRYVSLNWLDHQRLVQDAAQLPGAVRGLLQQARQQEQRFPQRFARPGYDHLANLAILALGGHPHAQRAAGCSLGRHACNAWTLCPYCAYLHQRDAVAAFHPLVHDLPRVSFATISPGRPLFCQEDCPTDDPLTFWDACQAAFWGSVHRSAFEGALLVEEFQPVSFLPEEVEPGGLTLLGLSREQFPTLERAQPHVHALILGDMTKGLEEDLINEVRNYDGRVRVPRKELKTYALSDVINRRHRWVSGRPQRIGYDVTIRISGAATSRDLRNFVNYLHKPVRWADAYRDSWRRSGAQHSPSVAFRFNIGVAHLVAAWSCATHLRPKFRGFGSLSPSSGLDFVGIRRTKRYTAQNKAALLDFLREC